MLKNVKEMLQHVKYINTSDLGTSLVTYIPFSPYRLYIRFNMSRYITCVIGSDSIKDSLLILSIKNDKNSVKFENTIYTIMNTVIDMYNNHKQKCDFNAIIDQCKTIAALDEL